ncbi:chromosome partitioning protein ParB [Nostoc minutum NIES-26]|uniref:Chromosome partitioning protein ParB n=1 Tax=Nostoc minutum NIES-26 TaxID=1844469 RepID=A0A367RWH1_9NOSO|nr:chromosome partitioning protein ParB [Nostoc minutum NIES-26]
MTTKKKDSLPFVVSSSSVLSSFISEEPVVGETAAEFLPLTAISLPTVQPRRYFNAQKMEQLKLSIQEHGILEPLLVRPIGKGQYELVAGERRYRAAKELALEKVPVVIRELDDKKAIQVALIENLQREDLNPIEETEGILELLTLELKEPKDEIISLLNLAANAKKRGNELTKNVLRQLEQIESVFAVIGKLTPDSFRTSRLPLLNMPVDILEALRQGRLEYTKAKVIARVDNEQQRKSLLEEAILQKLSLSEIKERVANLEIIGKNNKVNKNSYQARFLEVTSKIKQSKVWDDPNKQQKFASLLTELEQLITDV